MDRIAEINTEMARLKEEHTKLVNERDFGKEEAIKSLEWTKHCVGTLEINPSGGSGLPTYTITIAGNKIPASYKIVTVMGNDRSYQNNICFGKSYSHGDFDSFYTSSAEMLIEFLEKVEFKKFTFPDDHLNVLEAAKRKSEECL